MNDDSDTSRPVPKFKRRKNKFGQEVGNYYIKVGKRRVDLQTEDYIEARERAREAFYDGRADFKSEASANQRFYDTGSAGKTGLPAGSGAGDWTSDVAGAAASGIRPDMYASPSGKETPLLNPMPTEASGDGSPPKSEPGKDGSEDSTQIPPEMFQGIITQLADMAVELQIKGQEWLFMRYMKAEAGPVPLSSPARAMPRQIWEAQFKKWMPSDVPLPEWIVAPLLCAMLTIPVQIEGARPIKKDGTPPSVATP